MPAAQAVLVAMLAGTEILARARPDAAQAVCRRAGMFWLPLPAHYRDFKLELLRLIAAAAALLTKVNLLDTQIGYGTITTLLILDNNSRKFDMKFVSNASKIVRESRRQ